MRCGSCSKSYEECRNKGAKDTGAAPLLCLCSAHACLQMCAETHTSTVCACVQELAYLAGGLSLESMRRKTVDIPVVYPEVVPGVQSASSQPQQPPLDASLLPAVMNEDPAMVYAAKKSLGGELST